MEFLPVERKQEWMERAAFVCGEYRLAFLIYALGQTRVQLQHWQPGESISVDNPAILAPQFCTYQDGIASITLTVIAKSFAPLPDDASPEQIETALAQAAEALGGCNDWDEHGNWVPMGIRCKVDSNLGIEPPDPPRWLLPYFASVAECEAAP